MNSYWIESTKKLDKRNPINKNYKTDVCIVGAGITGLTTGYYLSKKGLKVIIIDKDNIGEKVSGNTTGKITLQHNLIYDYLINSYGKEFAREYFNANKEAIKNIKKIIDDEKIDCNFEYKPNIVYTKDKEKIKNIENEVYAINKLANNNTKTFASLISKCELPFEIESGIKVENQAQFHPRKYMYGLVRAIKENGGLIFTDTTIEEIIKKENNYILISNNNKVEAKYVVIATHYPNINLRGLYFTKMYQVTSYALGIETKSELFDGMYISAEEPVLSFRTAIENGKRFLIMAGGNHKTGFSPESEDNYGYQYLEKEAKKLYSDCKIVYRWNTRDCITLDKIPYIGKLSNFDNNMYVATGFNKWGMTSSNVAANIIRDGILGIENKYESIFNSTRFNPIKNKEELKNMMGQAFKAFISNRIKIPAEDLNVIENDNGGIIKINGVSVGIYKNKEGEIFAINPTCTHLGCLLTWNNLDKTWDCPCHGSRFSFTGKNIYDPAFKDLEKFQIDYNNS